MTRFVYTPDSRPVYANLLSPVRVVRDLWRYRELTWTLAQRDFTATYRSTFLGAAWTILSPLILLALFTFVFGYIFNGRFTGKADETPAEFALALFVGLSFYQCVAAALTQSPTLLMANASYVKSIAFPVETLAVGSVTIMMMNLLIGLALCQVGFLALHGFAYWTSVFLIVHIVCIGLIALGISWFLSALSVFIRDVPSVTSPLSMVLMFLSGVFFPIESLPPRLQLVFRANPLALIIDQARGAMLFGKVPSFTVMALALAISLLVAIAGYAFFMRSKPAFSDVM